MATKNHSKKGFRASQYSKGVVTQTKWNGSSPNVFPDFNLLKCVEMINYDTVARGALNHFVAKCMEGDISYVKKDTLDYDTATEKSLAAKYNFRNEVIEKQIRQLRLFNNAFIELIDHVEGVDTTELGKVKAINVLHSLNMEPGTESNGDPIGYTWSIMNPNGSGKPSWEAKDIVWVKYNDQSTGYSNIDMQALWENLLLKSYIKRYVSWLWQTGQYRVLYGFNAPQRVVDDFIAYLKNTESDYQAPLLFGGDFKTQMVRDMRENESIVNLLSSLDFQTAVLMRVPPTALGLQDNAGRGGAEMSDKAFNADITHMKKTVEDYTNNKLFPRIGKNNTLLRFGPNDRFAEKQAWEVVQIMKSSGATNEVCKEYLQDRGLFYAAKMFMPIPIEEAPKKTDDSGNPLNPRDKDAQASRVGKGTEEGNTTQDDVTTRKNQITKTED